MGKENTRAAIVSREYVTGIDWGCQALWTDFAVPPGSE